MIDAVSARRNRFGKINRNENRHDDFVVTKFGGTMYNLWFHVEIEQTFLGMLENYNPPLEIIQYIENGKENKRSKVGIYEQSFEKTVADTKANILKRKGQSLKEDISDFIRNWFREM